MRIGQDFKIKGKVKWNFFQRRRLCQGNGYKGQAYAVCTSPETHLLFEIVEARRIDSHYKTATLLALCQTRQQAIEYVSELIDALYNKQIITYAQLQV